MRKLTAIISVIVLICAAVGCAGTAKQTAVNPSQQAELKTEDPNIVKRTIAPATTALPVGNDKTDDQASATEAPNVDPDMIHKTDALYWDTASSGGSATEGVTYKVFSDYESFKKKFGEAADSFGDHYTERSFESIFVVAVSCTVRTGGYTFELNTGSVKNGSVDIDLKQIAPAPSSIVTQAFVTHQVLVAFDSAEYTDALEYNITVNGAEVLNGTQK